MKNFHALLALLSVLTLFSCGNKTNISKVPQIDLVGYSPDSVRAGNASDGVVIQFFLKDGDGDLGHDPDKSSEFDVYIKDKRAGIDTFVGYYFPLIDEEVKNNGKGLEGNAYFLLRGDFIYLRDDSIHYTLGDTTQIELYIKDIAGNESNRITTGNIYIRP